MAATPTSGERTLRALARRQHGVFTVQQAIQSGFSRPTIRRRLDRGVWEEVAPRVYRAAIARPVDGRQRLMALTIATGGVASGQSAAWLHKLVPEPSRHDIVLRRPPRVALNATVHTTTDLPMSDVAVVDEIHATAPARTLIDLGARLRRGALEEVVDAAIVNGLVTSERLATRAMELFAPRRSGCAAVLGVLADHHPELARAANGWEAKVLRLVGRLGLPRPRCNFPVRVGGVRRYIDLAWPEAMVAVELDGFVPHSTRRAFDDDRIRQNDLVAAGWTVFRLTWTALAADPRAAFAPVTNVLAAKTARFGTPALQIAQF